MRIRPYHFYIENFRNFRDTSFDLGRKITVVSGQNGVGKSNILSLISRQIILNKRINIFIIQMDVVFSFCNFYNTFN